MIRPRHSFVHGILSNWFLDWKFKSRFSSVNYFHEHPIPTDKSLLVIGNHATWWDGFLNWQMARYELKKTFYLAMLEEMLQKLWFFRGVGCFSINPGNRSMVESLNVAADLLKDPSNMVIFYPQGKYYSIYDHDFTFNSGISHIIKKANNSSILFYAALFDYSANEKPYLNIFTEISEPSLYPSHIDLQEAYKAFFERAKKKHIQNFVH